MEGVKFLILEKIDARTLKGKNDFVVAMDSVGAGPGEIVFFVAGSSARMTEATQGKPADASITAIVDFIELDGKIVYAKDGGAKQS
jgi:microcompartment protein CcmK/EutM